MNRLFTLAAGAALTLALGCGGNSAAPTAPGQTGGAEATGTNAIVSIRIESPTALAVGETAKLKVIARLAGGIETDVTARALFSVSNPAVATVSASGELKALAPGDCGLSAILGALTTNLNLSVHAKIDVLARLTVKGKVDIEVGEKTQLQAIATLDTGAEIDVTARAKFSSSNEAILKVSVSGELEAIAPGDCDILSIVDDVRATVRVKVRARVGGGDGEDPISRIEIRGKVALEVGEKTQLQAIALLRSGVELDVTAKASFSSSNEAILKISAGGVLEAVGPGDCDIISILDGVRAVVRVTVGAKPGQEDRIQRLEIRGKVSLDVGESTSLKVIAILQSGAELDVTAKAALQAGDGAILRLGAGATLEGIGLGDCDLLAIVDGIRATVKVKVGLGTISRLEILGAGTDLAIGAKLNVQVMATNAHGARVDVTGGAQLSTSNGAVLRIGAGGALEAIGPGTCDLIAVHGGVRASVHVSVKAGGGSEDRIQRLEIRGKVSLDIGESTSLKVIAILQSGAELDVTAKAALEASNGAILKIGAGATLEGVGLGDCDLLAIVDGIRATVKVKVELGQISRLEILGAGTDLAIGAKLNVQVMATNIHGIRVDVTASTQLSTSNSGVLRIGAGAVLEAVGPGACDLIAVNGAVRALLHLNVRANALTAVRLRIDGATGLTVGQTALLKVIATMSDNTEVDVTAKVNWSTNGGVCGLSLGILSALVPGECIVTALLDGLRASATINVSAAPSGPLAIVRLRLEGPSVLKIGQTAQLKVIATMSDNSEQDVTARATWSSNNVLSLLVNVTGLLRALLPGDCLITGVVDGIQASVTVKVTL